MNQLSTEAKVGGFSLIALILLAYMIIHLGNFSFGDKGYPVQASFNQVGGLKPGNVVRYAGVEIGRVQDVSVTPDGVNVHMLINPGVKIPAGAKFTIGSDGLLGEKFINILPPVNSSGFLPPNAVVRGEDPQGLDQLVSTADKVLLDVQKLVASLNDILGDEKVKTALKDSALNAKDITANLSVFSASLARMAQNNEGDVREMAGNLNAMSLGLNRLVNRVDGLVANMDNNGQTAKDLRETIENLKVTSERVEKIAAAVEGVATDPETARNLKETLQNARQASEKANKMLTKVQSVKADTGFEVLYNPDGSSSKYQSSVDMKISTSPGDFAVIGVNDIGEGNDFNFQVGKADGKWAARAGIVDSKAGIGVDAGIGNQMRLSVDLYDPNDVRYKLRTQLQMAPDTYLVGQRSKAENQSDYANYIGMRRTF